MKAHIGVDLASGLVHTVEGTSAKVADVAQAYTLLHGEEEQVVVGVDYQSVEKRPEIAARCSSRYPALIALFCLALNVAPNIPPKMLLIAKFSVFSTNSSTEDKNKSSCGQMHPYTAPFTAA